MNKIKLGMLLATIVVITALVISGVLAGMAIGGAVFDVSIVLTYFGLIKHLLGKDKGDKDDKVK